MSRNLHFWWEIQTPHKHNLAINTLITRGVSIQLLNNTNKSERRSDPLKFTRWWYSRFLQLYLSKHSWAKSELIPVINWGYFSSISDDTFFDGCCMWYVYITSMTLWTSTAGVMFRNLTYIIPKIQEFF